LEIGLIRMKSGSKLPHSKAPFGRDSKNYMKAIEGKLGRVFVLRLDHDDPIPKCMEDFAAEKEIQLAKDRKDKLPVWLWVLPGRHPF
jgi:hypothetical protein